MWNALGVFLFAAHEIKARENALVLQHVNVALVDERRRHVRTDLLLAPHDVRVRGLTFLEGDVAAGAGANDKDRRFRTPAACHHYQVSLIDRCGGGDLRAATETPQLFPRIGIVAADEVWRVGHKLDSPVARVDRRSSP